MGLPNMSQIVWAYTMTPIPRGVGHLISPRWLEEIQCVSVSLSLALPAKLCFRHAGTSRAVSFLCGGLEVGQAQDLRTLLRSGSTGKHSTTFRTALLLRVIHGGTLRLSAKLVMGMRAQLLRAKR